MIYDVTVYYRGSSNHEIEADSPEEALELAQQEDGINQDGIALEVESSLVLGE